MNHRLTALAEAARLERDRRREAYPAKIRAGGVSAEDANVDYQCWVAIAEWLETGRFFSFYGGADPNAQPGAVGEDGRATKGAPFIRWPELEAAASSALASVTATTDAEEAKPAPDADRLSRLYRRRASLVAIHRAVHLRRQTIDSSNAELRKRARARDVAA